MAVNRPGWAPRIGPRETSPWKSHRKLSATGTFPIRASESCRKLLTAEVWTIRACTAVWESCTVSLNGRDRPTDQRLVYGKSTRMLGSFLPFSFPEKWRVKSGKNNFSLYTICVEFPFSTPCWVELFVLNLLFYPHRRVAYWLCSVLYWILLKTHCLNVNWTLLKLYSLSFHLFISGVQSLWKIALTYNCMKK